MWFKRPRTSGIISPKVERTILDVREPTSPAHKQRIAYIGDKRATRSVINLVGGESPKGRGGFKFRVNDGNFVLSKLAMKR